MTGAPPRIAVVGGGPAGLMAATVAAAAGIAVDLYDAKPTVGRKLLLAGRSGLNLTHGEALPIFLTRYGAAAPALIDAIERFPPADLRDWLAELGVDTFVGSSGRVFPVGMKAAVFLRAWLRHLDGLGVHWHARHRWLGFADGGLRFDHDGRAVTAHPDASVLALGGASWPRLGSDGRWVEPFAAAGIAVAPLRPANCGFEADWSAAFAERWQGAPLKTVALAFDDRRIRGEITITRYGVEGGPVYALGAGLREAIAATGEAVPLLDLKPDLPLAEVERRLAQPRRRASLSNFLRRTLGLAGPVAALLRESGWRDDGAGDIRGLAGRLKAMPLRLRRPRPIAEAISSAGGVLFSEVDDSLMLRRRPGVFVAGEMLDWEAPTGGYLLQGAFSTGRRAGHGALTWLARRAASADLC